MNFHGHGSNRGGAGPYVPGTARLPGAGALRVRRRDGGRPRALPRRRWFRCRVLRVFRGRATSGWRLWVLGERVVYVPAALALPPPSRLGHGPDALALPPRAERARVALQELRRRPISRWCLPAARVLLAARGEAARRGRRPTRTREPSARLRRRAHGVASGARRDPERAGAVPITRSCRSFASRFDRAPAVARIGARSARSSASMVSRASSARRWSRPPMGSAISSTSSRVRSRL